MSLYARIKGLILSPRTEWETIETERTTIPELYVKYVMMFAALPPFASFFGAYFFGFKAGHNDLAHPDFTAGLLRAGAQYVLSLPALFLVAFILSMAAPHFDGRTDDRKAFLLVAYSYTPAWLASLFGLVPHLRWLDILGLYGLYVFYHGLPRMLKVPRDNSDVFTLMALVAAIAMGAVHAWIVRQIAPMTAM